MQNKRYRAFIEKDRDMTTLIRKVGWTTAIFLFWSSTVLGQEIFEIDETRSRYTTDNVLWRKIGDQRFQEIISSHKPSISNFNSGRAYRRWGNLLSGVGAGLVGAGVGYDLGSSDSERSGGFYVGGGTLLLAGIVLLKIGGTYIKRSADMYYDYVNQNQGSACYDGTRFRLSVCGNEAAIMLNLICYF
ncbi:MAG: hypothetical protein IH955_10360 [Chloroflexi bacterium]|nr:hypothetical protein [Chloroflexota bacterium]